MSLALTLRLAEGRIADDPDAAESLVAGARAELAAAIDELRDFARGLHPGILADRGLDAALAALASRAPMPVAIEGSSAGVWRPASSRPPTSWSPRRSRTSPSTRRPSTRRCSCAVANGSLLVEVSDDGVGGANPAAGSACAGCRTGWRRSTAGSRSKDHDGRGTVVRAAIPVG